MDREFSTSDLGEAAFCATKGAELLRIEMTGDRAWFCFQGDSAMVRSFHTPGQNLVDAKAFHAALRGLRGLARRGGR